ncbi:Pentatricopeptide repeat-containing protein [Melia azedarach]|uniref:Pentatricopeptide repeat-containing protein n=1 Tax=Melia azedarach TaxID=155640 RepID=A0ACC1XSG0_MELAZ|nr:Pentatricopeptide repeat-containing protein [Melia azedarach]
MLSLKNVSKSRAFISPLLVKSRPIFVEFDIQCSSLRNSCSCYSTTVAGVQGYNSLNARDVVISFKEWFNYKPQNSALLDRIFEILKTHDEDDLPSRFAADFALSQLGIRLSEAFVLDVLAYGKGKDVLSCLKFFDWAGRQPGYRHTRSTFHAIFKILSRAKLMPLMLDFLENYKKGRYYHPVRFNDTLVMGYALAGKPEIALQLFGKLRFQGFDLDEYSYHVLLNALVEEGFFHAVDVISKQISFRGFECAVTRSIMLKSLCKKKQLEEAVEYLQRLVNEEQPVSGYMISSVVDALCKNNKLEQAGKILEEFGDCGVVQLEQAYGVWLWNLVQAGRLDGALQFLKTKKSLEGYVPEVFRYNILVSRLLRENRLMEVFDLFGEMKENQISPDRVTINNALCFFCKAGMVDIAIELYNSSSEFGLSPNGMVYNYLINTLCGDGSTDEAYQLLQNSIDQGFFPGRKTFRILANALCREGKLEKMKDLVLFALDRNIMPTDSTYDKFISALCSARRVEDGYLILGELSRMNKVMSASSYCKLIHGFIKSNKGDVAARLLIEMQGKHHKPNRKVFRAVICCLCNMENPEKQYLQFLEMQLSRQETDFEIYNFFIDGAGHAKRPELARVVYEMMRRSGIEPTLSSHILMLQSYLKSERISDALNFFNDLHQRRRIWRKLYNTLIVGLSKAMKADIAFEYMQKMKNDGMIPSMECYEEIIKVLCSIKKYDMVVHVINDLENVGRHVTSFIGNILLLHSLKTQDLCDAWIRLRGLQTETSKISLLGQLIGVFSGRIKVSRDIEDVQKLIEQCFPLDTYTYNMLVRQLSMSEIDHACELFNTMRQKGYETNQWTYDVLKYGLYKCLGMDEAERRLKEMSWKGLDRLSV